MTKTTTRNVVVTLDFPVDDDNWRSYVIYKWLLVSAGIELADKNYEQKSTG